MFIIDKYLNYKFENEEIENLINFNGFVQELSQKLAPKTIRDIVNVLRAILNFFEDEYDCKLNYKRISVPKLEKSHIRIFTDKEKTKLEKYCFEENSLKSLSTISSNYVYNILHKKGKKRKST